MLVEITCRCGKTSDWDFQREDRFKCSCGEKINVMKVFCKRGFKYAVLENSMKKRAWVRFAPYWYLWWLLSPMLGTIWTLIAFQRKHLVSKGFSVVSMTAKKGQEPELVKFRIRPLYKRYIVSH